MSYREITVCLEHADSVRKLAIVASRLGAGLHAYVNGVHVIPKFTIHDSVATLIPTHVIEQIRNTERETTAAMKAEFGKIMSQGDTNWEWIESYSDSYTHYQSYLDYALNSDVVVTIQPHIDMFGLGLQRELLLKIGAPVVIVPSENEIKSFGQRIGIAWNKTPESARAVRDAMPLLATSEEVHIISVGVQNTANQSANTTRPTLDQYLTHHEIGSTHHELIGSHLSIGENLLDHAKNHNLDLLIMGGFGHSRLYDVVVGAVTGDVIKNMHIPVFLSH